MNQGFDLAGPEDWVLFWGSDDWAASSTVLAQVVAALSSANSQANQPHLLVCRGRYVDAATGRLDRTSVFQPDGMLTSSVYRRALWLGSTPPHQATVFGPGARSLLSRYSPGFRLSADLDYFLQLSSHPGLRVRCLDLELVHMSDAGVSGKQPQRRLHEVAVAYRQAFPWCWWFPFVARYIRRLASLFGL